MTDRQRQALDFIRGKQRTAGPTLRELAEHLGVAYSAAQRHVEALRETGEIYANDGNGLVLARPKAQPHPEEPLPKPDGFVVGKRAIERLLPMPLAAARADKAPILRPGEKKGRA